MGLIAMLAWHYTVGMWFQAIRLSGVLLPASSGVRPPERAILWFSLDQKFEPTARKAWIDNSSGQVRGTEYFYAIRAMAGRLDEVRSLLLRLCDPGDYEALSDAEAFFRLGEAEVAHG